MWMLTRNLGAGLAALGLLFGCGSDKSPGAPAGSAAYAAAHKAVTEDTQSRNMVAAVRAPKGTPVPVLVRYELRERPEIAQPLDVDIAIVPVSGSVDRIAGRVEVEDGLELVDGAQIPTADRPAEGTILRHTVKVVPKRDGIFSLRAVLTVDSAGQSSNETFSIPVIAGAGMPDLPAPAPGATPRPAGTPRSGS